MAVSFLAIFVVGGVLLFGLLMIGGGILWAVTQSRGNRHMSHIPSSQPLAQHDAQTHLHNNSHSPGFDPVTGAALGLAAGAMLHADQGAEPVVEQQPNPPQDIGTQPHQGLDPGVADPGPEIASNDFFDAGGFDGGGFDAGGDF